MPERLIDIASAVFLATEALRAYEALQELRPNPSAIRKVAENWYEGASHYSDSGGIIRSTYIQLGGYWRGRAFDAFQEYMKEVVAPVAESNAATMLAVGDGLIDVHNQIVDQYNAGMREYKETLVSAIEYHREMEVASGDAETAFRQALHDLLATWISNTMSLHASVREICHKNAGLMSSLRGQVLQLKAPESMPTVISDRSKWDRG